MTAESSTVSLLEAQEPFNWKRLVFMFLGIGLFCFVYYCPPWPDAIDPMGEHFVLNQQAKGAIGVFLLAATCGFLKLYPSVLQV